MARLTNAEKKLLRYPPTRSTWVCGKGRLQNDGTIRPCSVINSDNQHWCWACAALKPNKPILLWPQYEQACKKAGIQPGEEWRDPADAIELAAAYRQRQKAADKRRKGS